MTEKRLLFEINLLEEDCFDIYNKKSEFLGFIKKRRVGKFIHYVFEPESNIFITAGCLDETREFMRKCPQ